MAKGLRLMKVDGMNTLKANCLFCREDVLIPGLSDEQVERYVEGKELIQEIMPEVSPGKREILISGMCEDCFDEL